MALVFTDGEDTRHAIGWREVLDKARADGVMIYTIGLESNYFNGLRQVRSRPDGRLKTFRRGNRRRVFRPERHRRSGPDVHRVAQELHSQYVVGLAPSVQDGKLHELEVQVREPE